MRMSSFLRVGSVVLLSGVLLAGCLGWPATTLEPTFLPSTETSSPTPTVIPPASSATAAPTRRPTATTAPVQIEPEATRSVGQLTTSGWKLFSNPDFVRGIALENERVWTATSGGVLVWDTVTGRSQLYTPSDGLVEIQGNDVVYCPLPEERVVVAHESGVLSVYSPARAKWDQLPITFPDGSTLSSVQSLACDATGNRLVVGARNGLGILDWKTRTWQRLDQTNGLNLQDIRSIALRGLNIWIAAGKVGGYLILGTSVYALNHESGLPSGEMTDVALSSDGYAWIGYPTGLVRYKDRIWTPYTAQGPSGIPFRSVDWVEIGPDGKVWIASADEGVCPFDPKLIQCPVIYPEPRAYPITDLAVNASGAFVGTNGGGVRVMMEEKVSKFALASDQLSSNEVNDLAEDARGRLWLATARGVDILNPQDTQEPWEHIESSAYRLVSSIVTGVQPAPDGVWFYYQNQRQSSFYDGQNWSQLDEYHGMPGQVLDTAVDQRGYTWFATDQGIAIWDGLIMRGFDAEDTGLPTSRFQTLLVQGDTMWVGTDRGLLRYNRFTWETVVPDVSVQSIALEGADGLLLGTDRGLVRYRDGQSYFWIINLGDEAYLAPNTTAVALDRRGNIWVGSVGEGLFLFDGHSWQHFTTANGLPENTIRAIYVDRLGAVWISTISGTGGGGLVRYTP